jgi:hypothetical protein
LKRAKIKRIDDDISNIKIEVTKVKNALIAHYHKILNEGRDTRQEGLVWVLKEILLLGSNVMLSYLPNFLDEKCISYLFKVIFNF